MARQPSTNKSAKIVKNIPTTDSAPGVTCVTKSGKKYRISQDADRGKHTLWRSVEDGYEKLETADSPYDLYPLVDWDN